MLTELEIMELERLVKEYREEGQHYRISPRSDILTKRYYRNMDAVMRLEEGLRKLLQGGMYDNYYSRPAGTGSDTAAAAGETRSAG
jgi:hypothetical protein